MATMVVKGDIPLIVRNDDNVYEGNLRGYIYIIFHVAQNLTNPYHNFRHSFHVLYLCYQACRFYEHMLTRREMRNLLIAAMFHDFDHTGKVGNDIEQIERAVAGLRKHLLPVDRPHLDEIEALIRLTEFPYKVPSSEIELRAQVLRDADLSQALSMAWIQQIVFGLAEEWGKKPLDVLRMQEGFLSNLKFATLWGQMMFPQESVNAKIEEARQLLELLVPV